MSKYYTDAGKEVFNGDVADDSDLNDINTSVDTGFELVEVDIVTATDSVQYYAGRAEEWAESDVEIDIGSYSSKYYAEAAGVSAGEASDSAAAALASQTAAAASEEALAGVGTAAFEDIQTDDYQNGNYVMMAGAFGLGTVATKTYGFSGDENILDNDNLPTQFFACGAGDCEFIGGPVATPESISYGVGLIITSGSLSFQLFCENGVFSNGYSQRMWYRTTSTTVEIPWNPWIEINTSAI